MIHRLKGEIAFECDKCHETIETGNSRWDEAFNQAKSEGWSARKVGNLWTHACPTCEEKR